MTVAQITPPTPRTEALAGHAYGLPWSASARFRSPTPPPTARGNHLAASGR
jgi:hypothetical protein